MLSKPDLLRYIETRALRFDPEIAEDAVAQVSIDLRSTPLDDAELHGTRDGDVFQHESDPIPRKSLQSS